MKNNKLLKAGCIPVSSENVTKDQPFESGTAGSQYFRIPVLVTLPDGTMVTAADARWETTEDGGGLDTIASISKDGGKTWNYGFPIYFPDSNGYAGTAATTVIDAVIVRDNDGTLYCVADLNPTGVTTYYIYTCPGTGTGYVDINGVQRLPLTSVYDNVNTRPTADDKTTYEYYVGDFVDGFAPILKRADDSATEYGVDEWFNLYTVKDGVYTADLTQKQVNSDTIIQQNAFYKDSILHVYNTGYMFMVSSKDNGVTWGNPVILNPQIKRDDELAMLVSPGKGLLTSKGDLLFPYYTHDRKCEFSSFTYSSDHGKTWKRTNDVNNMASSESELIELPNGDIRMFFRNFTGHICYADAVRDENGDYTFGKGQAIETISVESTCNLTAINYSKQIDGKPVVVIACPGGPERKNGKVFGFTLEEDNSMTLIKTFDVPGSENGYCYSCIDELPDGSIALLWEQSHSEIKYMNVQLF